MTAFNGKTIAYTAGTGVMTGYGDYALTWFKIGLLGSYSKTGDTHTFTYDMDGRRLSRTDNGTTTTFVYAGDQLVGQTWGGNTLAFICNAAGEYIGFTYNGTNYYYVKNLQGDVVQIVNAAKTTVVKYYYDAWGYNFATEGSLASTVGAVNPIRYRGYYYDSGTGLYYLHSRYYNPELRRFISPDKLLDTQSLDGYNLFGTLFFGYEDGFEYSIQRSSGESILTFVLETAHDWDGILEQGCGIATNLNTFEASFMVRGSSIAIALTTDKFSGEVFIGFDKIGELLMDTAETDEFGLSYYQEYYIRPWSIIGAYGLIKTCLKFATTVVFASIGAIA